MIELSRHIEALLLEHDCVIVPGLGGFVTQYVPACRLPDEVLFLPPHRTVGFNAELTLNDGLLVQSYMQAYDTSYPETVRMIEEAVADLKCELLEKGRIELKGIGVLTLNLGGSYNFQPGEAGVLSPDLYGLSPFTVEPVRAARDSKPETAPRNEDQEADTAEKPKKNYTLSINREVCNYVAAAVVAVVFYFLWATPIGVENQSAEKAPAVASVPFTAEPAAASPQKRVGHNEVTTAQQKKNNAANTPQTATKKQAAGADNKKQTAGADNKKQVAATGNYTLVLASSVTQKNAESYVRELQSKGLKEAAVHVKRKMVRVIYGQYKTENEAYRELRSLRKKHKAFAEAWVMALK